MEMQKWVNELQVFKRAIAQDWINYLSIDEHGEIYGYLDKPIRQGTRAIVPKWFSYIQCVKLGRLPAVPAGIDRAELSNTIWQRSENVWTLL
jgi:hypothetical protein